MTGAAAAASRWAGRLALLLAAAAAVRALALGVQGWPDETTHVRDDAFYEFVWAGNLVRHGSPSVSDGTTTSGVSLVWSAVLGYLGGGHAGATKTLAVLLGGACHVAGALSWVLAGRGRLWAWCLALLWLGNPLLLRECQNGQETALAALLLAALWHLRRARERWFAAVGALLLFTRSDLFGCFLLLSLARHGRRCWRGLPGPLVLLGLFLGNNRLLGHGWLPDSAPPMAWLGHAVFAATEPGSKEWLARQWWYTRPVLLGGPFDLVSAAGFGVLVFRVCRPFWPRAGRWLPAGAVLLGALVGADDVRAAAIAALLLGLLPARARRPLPWPHLALLGGATALVALHWAVRWYPRDYYLVPLLVPALAALQAVRRVPWLLLLASVASLTIAPSVRLEPLRGQETMQMAGRFLHRLLPAGERVGCFNSGLVTFYGRDAGEEPLRVVNLDGVVDGRAFAALRAHRLADWLDEQRIRFLVDNPRQFARAPGVMHACGAFFGGGFDAKADLVEVARFVLPDTPIGEPFALYWRRGRGEPPAPPPSALDLGPSPAGGRCLLWPAAAGTTLEVETAAGGRRALATAPVATTVVLGLGAGDLGSGRFFVRGAAAPVLVLGKGGR